MHEREGPILIASGKAEGWHQTEIYAARRKYKQSYLRDVLSHFIRYCCFTHSDSKPSFCSCYYYHHHHHQHLFRKRLPHLKLSLFQKIPQYKYFIVVVMTLLINVNLCCVFKGIIAACAFVVFFFSLFFFLQYNTWQTESGLMTENNVIFVTVEMPLDLRQAKLSSVKRYMNGALFQKEDLPTQI